MKRRCIRHTLAAASLTSPSAWAQPAAPPNRVMRLGILGIYPYPAATEEANRQAMRQRGWDGAGRRPLRAQPCPVAPAAWASRK
jgi:hypothetical protein